MSFLTIFTIALAVFAFAPQIGPEALDWLPSWLQALMTTMITLMVWGIVKFVLGLGLSAALFSLRLKLMGLLGGSGAAVAGYWDEIERWISSGG